MVLGALLGTLGVKGGAVPAIGAASGAFATVAYIVILLGSISSNVLNMYSGAMGGLTWDMPLKRTGASLVIGIIGLALSLFFGGPQFVKFYESFLFILIYWCTPWIAIIGIDFYLFHRGGQGYPNALEFYKKNGLFGSVRWPGLLSLLIGIAVSVPFMATDLYTGPIGKALGDADFSYIVSFIVAGLIYLVAGRPSTVTRQSPAPAAD
jgi:NCS1 family nucleobase:cation symporter-1